MIYQMCDSVTKLSFIVPPKYLQFCSTLDKTLQFLELLKNGNIFTSERNNDEQFGYNI